MNWIEKCLHEAKQLAPEQRQDVLSELRSGKTIGETCEKFHLTLEAVCGVVDMNIVHHEYMTLNEKSN